MFYQTAPDIYQVYGKMHLLASVVTVLMFSFPPTLKKKKIQEMFQNTVDFLRQWTK